MSKTILDAPFRKQLAHKCPPRTTAIQHPSARTASNSFRLAADLFAFATDVPFSNFSIPFSNLSILFFKFTNGLNAPNQCPYGIFVLFRSPLVPTQLICRIRISNFSSCQNAFCAEHFGLVEGFSSFSHPTKNNNRILITPGNYYLFKYLFMKLFASASLH